MSSELSGSRGSVDAEESWLPHPVTLHGAKWMFCSYVSGHCPDEEYKNKSTSLKRTSKQLAYTGRVQSYPPENTNKPGPERGSF